MERRSSEIDVLRAWAILLVLVYHLRGAFFSSAPAFLTETWSGVDLFFVISGFLITFSFANWMEQDADCPATRFKLALVYFARRLVRILPVALAWAAVPLFLSYGFNESGYQGYPLFVMKEFFAVVKFTYNYFSAQTGYGMLGPFWSLSVEEHFYLFLPLYLAFVRSFSGRALGLIVLFMAICALRFLSWKHQAYTPLALRFYTQFRVDGLLLGSALGLFFAHNSHLIGQAKLKLRRASGPLRTLSATLLLSLWLLPGWKSGDDAIPYIFPLLAFASFGLVSIASLEEGLIIPPGPLQSIFAFIGRRSYSIYLIHVPVLTSMYELRYRIYHVMNGWPSAFALLSGVSFYLLALTVLVELNYRFFEQPCMMLARRYFRIKGE